MTLRVLHAATHAHNVGDGALVSGMHATLARDLGVDLAVERIDVFDCKLDGRREMLPPQRWSEMAPRTDLVLVGGGGMIEGGLGNYLSGLNFNFRLDLLERSHVPWVFYALGHNLFRRRHFHHRQRLARLLSIVERRGWLFSVRNDGSKVRLERLLDRSLPFVRNIPDPGLYVPVRQRRVPELATDRPNVVVQLGGDLPGARFGSRPRRMLRTLLRRDPFARLAATLTRVVQATGARLILCPHLVADLTPLARLAALLPKRVVRESCSTSPVLTGAAAGDFFDLYRQADLVVGMRGHSAICSVGLGTPFIGLATHDKIAGFLDELGLGEFGFDLDENPRLDGLDQAILEILATPEPVRQRLVDLRRDLRARTREFHREIAALLGVPWST